MFEEDFAESWNWRIRPVLGCAVGVFLVVGLGRAQLLATPSSATAGLFGASAGNSLRVLQSVGILLPLFVALLRFTTSDQSEVSDQVNNHLLLGIFGLVLAGVSTVIAGMATTMAGILKLALSFVLVTFIVIGVAAGTMFGEFTTGTDSERSVTETHEETDDAKQSVVDDEDTSCPEVESETGARSNDKNDRGEQGETVASEDNNYDDRD